MANAYGRKIDHTFLSIDAAEERGFIGRDYIAHCLRWTHVAKWINQKKRYKESDILDVGCGKEIPLAKLLHSSRLGSRTYTAIDHGKLQMPAQFANSTWKPTHVIGNCDAAELVPPITPNVIVCFEVLEHVEPEHCKRILNNFRRILTEDGTIFLSTPCYDERVGAADNHVNEMTYEAFGRVIEDAGFWIEGHWGTFASMADYKNDLTGPQRIVFDQFREYYDSNYLATIFAPLFPQYSRNCLWQIKKSRERTTTLMFPAWKYIKTPWGSSDNWKDLETK